jgi:hypothetical protein
MTQNHPLDFLMSQKQIADLAHLTGPAVKTPHGRPNE